MVPKRMTLAKAFFLSLSNRWNIPVMRLQLMKVCVSSSGKRYSAYHRDQPSLSKCSQKYGSATERVSSLEYLRLNSSNTKVLLGRWAKGPLPWAQQPVPARIRPSLPQELGQLPFSPLSAQPGASASPPVSLSLSVECPFRLALCKLFSIKLGHLLTQFHLPKTARNWG